MQDTNVICPLKIYLKNTAVNVVFIVSPQHHLFTFLFLTNNQVIIILMPIVPIQVSCEIYVQCHIIFFICV